MADSASQHSSAGGPKIAPDRLLAAAEGIVLRGGANLVTIRAIGRASGLNSALISYHFGGLDALLARLVELNVDAVCEAREAALKAALRVKGKNRRLEALVTAYLEPLWRTPARWHVGPARTVIRTLMPLLDPSLRQAVVARINRSVEESQEPLLFLLPHLSRDALQLRLQLLAGAADELRIRAHAMGLFPLRGTDASGRDRPLRDELITLALAGLRAASRPVST